MYSKFLCVYMYCWLIHCRKIKPRINNYRLLSCSKWENTFMSTRRSSHTSRSQWLRQSVSNGTNRIYVEKDILKSNWKASSKDLKDSECIKWIKEEKPNLFTKTSHVSFPLLSFSLITKSNLDFREAFW